MNIIKRHLTIALLTCSISVAFADAAPSKAVQIAHLLEELQALSASGRNDEAFRRCEQVLEIDPYNIAARLQQEKIKPKHLLYEYSWFKRAQQKLAEAKAEVSTSTIDEQPATKPNTSGRAQVAKIPEPTEKQKANILETSMFLLNAREKVEKALANPAQTKGVPESKLAEISREVQRRYASNEAPWPDGWTRGWPIQNE